MDVVIQEDETGCGIAAVANLLGNSYAEIKSQASSMGIDVTDEQLWSDTYYVRRLLSAAGVIMSDCEIPFESWAALPDLALLAIKHRRDEASGKNYWHWVVFKRGEGTPHVIDSASYLSANIRTDFDTMQPAWFIAIHLP